MPPRVLHIAFCIASLLSTKAAHGWGQSRLKLRATQASDCLMCTCCCGLQRFRVVHPPHGLYFNAAPQECSKTNDMPHWFVCSPRRGGGGILKPSTHCFLKPSTYCSYSSRKVDFVCPQLSRFWFASHFVSQKRNLGEEGGWVSLLLRVLYSCALT